VSVSENRIAVLYALAFLPGGGLALAASGWVMDLTHRQAPGPISDLAGWLLNVLPSLAVGFVVYFCLAHVLVSAGLEGRSRRSHVRRSAALYVVAIGLGALLLHDGRSPDFWTFGQLVLWTWVTAAAGILADALTIVRRRRAASAA
jgi:hypothetical protein